MSFARVWAVFLRYFYYFARLDNFSEVFYFPTIDILLWGITGVWIQSQSANVPDLALAILTGLVYWQILWRGNHEVTINLLQEFWSRNLVNLFSTPLKLREWMSAVMLVGFFKILMTIAYSSLLVFILYSLNVYQVGWAIIPFATLLTLSGWMLGFLSSTVIIYHGQKFQMLGWMTPLIFVPFSAVFYPISALPGWAQTIGWSLPTTYVFEAMRNILIGGPFLWNYFWMSLTLNVVYLSCAMLLFKFSYERSRNKGLARLD